MKGFLSSFLGWLVIVIVALIIILFVAWSRFPDVVANNLSKKLKVSVEIDDINLSYSKIDVENFEISNVPGGVLQKAFSAEQILFKTPLHNYFEKAILIEEIDVNNVYLGLEFDSSQGTKGNWTKIMNNLQSSMQAEAEKNKDAPSSHSVFIRSLVLTNIQVDVVYLKEGGKVKRLPPINRIELKNISSEKGIPMDQIMNSVLGQMLQSVFMQQNLKNMMDGMLNQPQGAIDNFLQPFKGLFNSNRETEEKDQLAS